MRSSSRLGVALVGLGGYSTQELGPALRQTKSCYLAGIVTGTPKKAEDWARRYQLPDSNVYNYQDFDNIATNTDIDIVYVVLPNALHAEFVLRAAAAGKHVICEKPMALTVRECDQVIAACRDAGVKLSVGYRLHFDPFNQEMMRLATSAQFGKIKTISASHGLNEAQGWRLDRQLAGGGPLMDVGIYCVNAGRYLTGMEPDMVEARESGINRQAGEIESSLDWKMVYPNGVTANCACSYTAYGNLLRVDAERGWFELSPAFSYRDLKGKTADGPMHVQPANQQAAQMDDFALAIIGGRNSPVPGELGRADLRIIEGIYESWQTARPIKLRNTL
jgi:predicted dehydrogenase